MLNYKIPTDLHIPLPLFAFTAFVVAFACLLLPRYSRDGDLAEKHQGSREGKALSKVDAWDRLRVLCTVQSSEVTWIHTFSTSLVIALTFVFLLHVCVDTPPSSAMLFLASFFAFTVAFAMQDAVIRWKKAHRYNPTEQEQLHLIEMLRYKGSNLV